MLTFLYFKFKNKWDRESSHFNYNLKHYDKCKFTLKLIWLLTVSNLFLMKVVATCQNSQLCVLRPEKFESDNITTDFIFEKLDRFSFEW